MALYTSLLPSAVPRTSKIYKKCNDKLRKKYVYGEDTSGYALELKTCLTREMRKDPAYRTEIKGTKEQLMNFRQYRLRPVAEIDQCMTSAESYSFFSKMAGDEEKFNQACRGIYKSRKGKYAEKDIKRLVSRYGKERVLIIDRGPNAEKQAIEWRRKHPSNVAVIVHKFAGRNAEKLAMLFGTAVLGIGVYNTIGGASAAATVGGQTTSTAGAATTAKVATATTATTAAKAGATLKTAGTVAGSAAGLAKVTGAKPQKPQVVRNLEEATQYVDAISNLYQSSNKMAGATRPNAKNIRYAGEPGSGLNEPVNAAQTNERPPIGKLLLYGIGGIAAFVLMGGA